MVEVDEFGFIQFVDVDLHQSSALSAGLAIFRTCQPNPPRADYT